MGSSVDIILAVLAASFVVYYIVQTLRKKKSFADPTDMVVTVADVEKVLDAVKSSAKVEVFAVFLIPSERGTKEDGLPSIEFSMENGVVGIDYVLLSKENVARRHEFVELAVSRGHHISEHEMASVPYLRVEDGNLSALLRAALTDVFGVHEKDNLSIVLEGVDYASIA
ncbi:MAG: hypothetical protein NTX15_09505 [Candidatus Kapabacteria bacterium]|nr:hypothetical protein [Candidatus Kapabacteria bacterium]